MKIKTQQKECNKAFEEGFKDFYKYCIERKLYCATLFNDTILFMIDKHKELNTKQ